MNDVTSFTLRICRTPERFCNFKLFQDEILHIEENISFDDRISNSFEKWQKSYVKYIESKSRNPELTGKGSGKPKEKELRSLLCENEKKLLEYFYAWIENTPLGGIRKKIIDSPTSINIYLDCDEAFERLPWETSWLGLSEENRSGIQISRRASNIKSPPITRKHGDKKKILAIAGDDINIDLTKDYAILETLRSYADVIFCGNWGENTSENASTNLVQNIRDQLEDKDGWDMLFFAGHSSENNISDCSILIDGKDISLNEIKSSLVKAHENGLQFIMLNSCDGLGWAKGLTEIGFAQVLIMREKIHNSLAQILLKEFVDRLKQGEDVYKAVEWTRDKIEEIKIDHPSAYLIPSLFCHPKAELFRLVDIQRPEPIIEPEAQSTIHWSIRFIVLILTLLSLLPQIQVIPIGIAIDVEQLVISLVRQHLLPKKEPKIVLVHIDQDSLYVDSRTRNKNHNG
jgi:CHAT domain